MHSSRKTLWSLAVVVGLVGGVAACAEELAPATEDEETSVPGPQLGAPYSGWPTRIETSCSGSIPTRSTGAAINVDCIDIWSPVTNISLADDVPVGGYQTFVCDPVGTLVSNPTTRRSAKLPTSSHFFHLEEDSPFLAAVQGDSWNGNNWESMKFTVHGTRPAENQPITCIHNGVWGPTEVTTRFDIVGPVPYLASMTVTGTMAVEWGNTTQLTPNYKDQYNYVNYLTPVPSTTWQSNNTSIATVNGSGLVTGVSHGTAQVRACGMNGASQVCSPWYDLSVNGTTVTNPQSSQPQVVGLSTTGSTTFTVTNNTGSSKTIALSCSSIGSISCGSLSATSVTLNGNSSTTVIVGYAASGVWGQGTLRLDAAGGGNATVGYLVQGGPLTASINYGPTSVKPGAMCEWMATASGGYTPYTWEWKVDGNPVSGTDNDLYYTNSKSHGQSFLLEITVTDPNSATITASRVVTVNTSAPTCDL